MLKVSTTWYDLDQVKSFVDVIVESPNLEFKLRHTKSSGTIRKSCSLMEIRGSKLERNNDKRRCRIKHLIFYGLRT
jgi:hypothetical protein